MSDEIETFPCSDGNCPNIVDGRMLLVFNILGAIPGGMSALTSYLKNKGFEVNRNSRCQPGKAICVKRKENNS